MDSRNTFKINETFLEILQNLQASKKKSAILLDHKGMITVEGIIDKIELNVYTPYIRMQSGIKIAIKTLVAVNGYHLPEYATS